jgi:hypothetical protein
MDLVHSFARQTRKYLRKILTAGLLLFVPAWAATYCISPRGNDSKDGTTEENAVLSFSKAFALMAAGDELVLLDGTYSNETGTGYINYDDGSA